MTLRKRTAEECGSAAADQSSSGGSVSSAHVCVCVSVCVHMLSWYLGHCVTVCVAHRTVCLINKSQTASHAGSAVAVSRLASFTPLSVACVASAAESRLGRHRLSGRISELAVSLL